MLKWVARYTWMAVNIPGQTAQGINMCWKWVTNSVCGG